MSVLCWRVLYSHGDSELRSRNIWPSYRLVYVDVLEDGGHFMYVNRADRGFFCSLPLAIYPMIEDVPKQLLEIPIWPK